MSELKRTQLYDVHVAAGAEMVDFGGWEMPIQYPSGIIAEHLYTRQVCSLFDVSHMGRLLIEGPERRAFLQHVLTSNVAALDVGLAQYCIIPNENGGAVDDAYLYMFEEDNYLLVVNAANTEKDLAHLRQALAGFDCTITDISGDWAAIAVQGPRSKEMLTALNGGAQMTEPMKNALGLVSLEGHEARVAKTGYTGEPLGYEVYVRSGDAAWLWNRLVEMGARPAGLGARDTLRMEACMPLYGHEMGTAPDGSEIPIFAVPLAKFAVSFSEQKGDYIGRAALEKQHGYFVKYMDRDFADMSGLPRKIAPIALLDRGVMRAGMEIYQGDRLVGWVTSGTMVPYFKTEGEGLSTVILEASGKRAIGLCYINSDILENDTVEVDVRGRRLKAVIPARHMSVGALHDYLAIDPVTEKPAVVNFPVCADNPYRMDVEETKKLLDRYRPELIVFGKSMVLHKEPVAEIRKFVDEQKIPTTIMYDMAHVLGLIGDHFQNPFAEGAELVTGSTHKTFFGPQRGIIGVNYKEDDLKYGLWKTIESRTFPGSVSNHHLGTQLGMLMAAYEMNQFRDAYQKAVIDNARSFARSLKAHGLDVAGDPAIGYTETHQVIVSVGYGEGPDIAERLERNNIVVNYQATPDEEGFTASGALRMGVSEMTRFGFEAADFHRLAGLMADCILRGTDVKAEVQKLRSEHLEMRYCFDDAAIDAALERLAAKLV